MNIFLLCTIPFTLWFLSFVGTFLWSWFVTETFGITSITQSQFFGLALLLDLVKLKLGNKEEQKSVETYLGEYWKYNLTIAILFVVGWLVHTFF